MLKKCKFDFTKVKSIKKEAHFLSLLKMLFLHNPLNPRQLTTLALGVSPKTALASQGGETLKVFSYLSYFSPTFLEKGGALCRGYGRLGG
jgi:hypothetical protein